MPRKPRRRAVKIYPQLPPMATRSQTRANKSLDDLLSSTSTARKDDSKMPYLATLIAAALEADSASLSPLAAVVKTTETSEPAKVAPVPAVVAAKSMATLSSSTPVKIAPAQVPALAAPASPFCTATPPPAAALLPVAPSISPSSKEKTRPKRRKREAIHLPSNIAVSKMSAKDLRRLKNRISAHRLRQRSQEDLRSMQEKLEYYKTRCELLEIVVSGYNTCASLSIVNFGEIELLPAEKEVKINKEQTSDDEECIEDEEDRTSVLTEAECVVLDSVLQC